VISLPALQSFWANGGADKALLAMRDSTAKVKAWLNMTSDTRKIRKEKVGSGRR
jgi:hypothetical protein